MAHCTNSLHCGSRLTSSLEKAVRCSSLSSPEGPHPPPKGLGAQGSICTGGAGLLQVVFPPPPPVGVGGACLYVHAACMYGCMYVFLCKYVCVYL